jgi:hypothetical protein
MQITIRYVGGTAAARRELTSLIRQAGYAIRASAQGKDGARATGRQRTAVMTVTAAPPDGRGKLRTSRTGGTNLRGLRESVGRTQGEIARRTAMSQPQLSRLESRKDHLISTLRKYVRALGGEIEVVALIGGRRVSLRDV